MSDLRTLRVAQKPNAPEDPPTLDSLDKHALHDSIRGNGGEVRDPPGNSNDLLDALVRATIASTQVDADPSPPAGPSKPEALTTKKAIKPSGPSIPRPAGAKGYDAASSAKKASSGPADDPEKGLDLLGGTYFDKQVDDDGKVTSKTSLSSDGYKHKDASGERSLSKKGYSQSRKDGDHTSSFAIDGSGFSIGTKDKDEDGVTTGSTTGFKSGNITHTATFDDGEGTKRSTGGHLGATGGGFAISRESGKDEAKQSTKGGADIDVQKGTIGGNFSSSTGDKTSQEGFSTKAGLDLTKRQITGNYTSTSQSGTTSQRNVSHDGHLGMDGLGYTYTRTGKDDTGKLDDDGKPVLKDRTDLKIGGSVNWAERSGSFEAGNDAFSAKGSLNLKKKEASAGFKTKDVQANLGVGWGETKSLSVDAGTADWGAGLNVSKNKHTTSAGARVMVEGMGASIHGHRTKNKQDVLTQSDDALLGGKSKGKSIRDARGGGGEIGVPFVKVGGHYASGETNSYGMSQERQDSFTDGEGYGLDVLFGDADARREARGKWLEKQARKGSDGLDFDALHHGESLTASKDRTYGGNLGVNALGLANAGVKHDRSSATSGSIAKDDYGGKVASVTKRAAHSTTIEAGGGFGALSGEVKLDRGTESTTGFYNKAGKEDAEITKRLADYAKTGEGIEAGDAEVGDEVADGLQLGHARKLKTSDNSGKAAIAWGLLGGKLEKSTTKLTDDRLIHGGNGARLSTSEQQKSNKEGTILGFGANKSTTSVTSTEAGFTGSAKEGQSEEDNAADFKRLRAQAREGDTDIRKLKSGESIALTKASASENKGKAKILGYTAKKWDESIETARTTTATRTDDGGTVGLSGTRKDKQEDRTNGTEYGINFRGGDDALEKLGSIASSGVATGSTVDALRDAKKRVRDLEAELADIEANGRTEKRWYGKSDTTKAERKRVTKEIAAAKADVDAAKHAAEERVAKAVRVGSKIGDATLDSTRHVESYDETMSNKTGIYGFRKTHQAVQSSTATRSAKQTDDGVVAEHVKKLDYTFKTKGKKDDIHNKSSFSVSAKSEEDASAVSIIFSSTDGGTATKGRIDLDKTTIQALAAHYNEGEQSEAYWKRLAAAAASVASTDEVGAVFSGISSAEDFGKLPAKTQHLFLDAALKGQGEDANPFDMIAAIEALGDEPQGKANQYAEMFTAMARAGVSQDQKFEAITKTNGNSLREKLSTYAYKLHDEDPGLAKKLVDGIDKDASKKDTRKKEKAVLKDKLDYKQYR